jgi:dihydroorotase
MKGMLIVVDGESKKPMMQYSCEEAFVKLTLQTLKSRWEHATVLKTHLMETDYGEMARNRSNNEILFQRWGNFEL